MSKLLGLIDSLEACILESSKIPMTNKVVLEEDIILDIINKLRIVTSQTDDHVVMNSIDCTVKENKLSKEDEHLKQETNTINNDIEQAENIKKGANEYADFVLSNLQLVVTKLQKDIVKLERNIDNGRRVIGEKKRSDNKGVQVNES
ncbi:hypothetical protein DID75_03825 [Candidatus Marinamargulisbacteria bacterium SCGC AG-410-N11]|nr:hypothetical protein DID75_03825 [Candidatus Marinamargulisbacteria bacterium SCGC AG-410-N11]